MQNIKEFLSSLTHYPGVYQMLGEQSEVLYVGKAKDLKKRIASYFNNQPKDIKTSTLVKHIKNIDVTVTHSENEAVLLECNLIKKHRPRYNVLLRDDKSYPYIVISKQHPYPRIDFYRGARKKNALYFGPYPSAGAVRETISLLQKLFRIRTCRDSYFEARNRPCLLYQIGRCAGPCVGEISHDEYEHNINLAILFLQGKSHLVIEALQKKMENAASQLDFELAAQLRDQINRLRQMQDKQYVSVNEGNADVIGFALRAGIACIQLLSIRGGQVSGSRSYFPSLPSHAEKEEIISAFLSQHYLCHPSHIDAIPKEILVDIELSDFKVLENVLSEQVKQRVKISTPSRGDKKQWLTMAATSAAESLNAHFHNKANMKERMNALQEVLALPELPTRIECFDISHSMGEATMASCVVFDSNGAVKSNYRRFNIKEVKGGDDVAAMRQVLMRRFKRLQKDQVKLPDIVLIDGGRTQLAAAKQVMHELNIDEVFLMSVSKGEGRKPGLETLHFIDRGSMHLPSDSLALHFIQQIRDEAHRFAIAGHRMRRDKARQQSTLELIPGIGAKRRRELLRYFGGIQGVAHASLDELSKVPGISRSLAEKIFATLHDAT